MGITLQDWGLSSNRKEHTGGEVGGEELGVVAHANKQQLRRLRPEDQI